MAAVAGDGGRQSGLLGVLLDRADAAAGGARQTLAGRHDAGRRSVFRLRLALKVERHAVDARVQHAHHHQSHPEVAHL